jgi:hypothetical protein
MKGSGAALGTGGVLDGRVSAEDPAREGPYVSATVGARLGAVNTSMYLSSL